MTKTIYVGNMLFTLTQETLNDLFKVYGNIVESIIITDKYTSNSKGFGFVTFVNDDDANKAISEMNDKEIDGRKLKVNEAREER